MRKILSLLFLVLVVTACKKTAIEPEGPTDVRVYNMTDYAFSNVTVNTSMEEFNFGTIQPKVSSAYHRFEKAYPKSDITLSINGVLYSTPVRDYTYMQYMGQMKITYKVFISNEVLKQIDTNVVPDGELDY